MSIIRRHFSGIDGSFTCDECSEPAEIVIEEFPTRRERKSLCRDCATIALQEHPRLLASAVITLILRTKNSVTESSVTASST